MPVVVVGTDRMTDVERWLPGKYGRVWVAVGEAIMPPAFPQRRSDRRQARRALAERVEAAYVELYEEILSTTGLDDAYTP